MAEADWTVMVGSALDTNDVPRGVTTAFTPPSGGGSFMYGFRSIVSTTGFAGLYCNLTNFAPFSGTLKGGSVRGVMKRYSSGANYAPMMGLLVGTDPTTAEGYMIGLSEATAYQIVVKKGSPAAGLDASSSSILRESTSSFTDVGDAAAAWFHLRMDVLVNPHGETVINVYRNDLSSYPIGGSFTWAAITGMDQYIDDSIGVLSGTLPHTTGFYAFFGHYTEGSGTTSLFDHISVYRQTAP
jgi:hypothetical protein